MPVAKVCFASQEARGISQAKIEMSFLDKQVDNHFAGYVSGFVDGEGCFSVSFRKLGRTRVGLEVTPSFSIGQNKTPENYALLLRIRDMFKGGSIRSDNKRKGIYKYETRSLGHLRKHVIPFFLANPLHTQKSKDFQYFCEICSLMAARQHCNYKGFLQILEIAEKMNVSGTRRYSLLELRAALLKKHNLHEVQTRMNGITTSPLS